MQEHSKRANANRGDGHHVHHQHVDGKLEPVAQSGCTDQHRHVPEAGAAIKDPVCGMLVNEQLPHFADYGGRTYYFCSARCQAKFQAEPARYATPAGSTSPPAADADAEAGTIYTCPMHPEIRQDHPGTCPKCGMTLEPVIPELDEEENPELKDFRRRFWWILPLTIVVTVLAMFGHKFGWFEARTQSWIELALSIPIVLWAGWPFFVRGVESIAHRSSNMWTLIGLGTGAAFVYSVVATIAPQVFPASFMVMGRIGVYFEAAAVIISLTLLGQVLELKARADLGGDQILAQARAEGGAPHQCRWRRGGCAADTRPCRRSPPCPARRKSAGGWRSDRGNQRGR